MSTRNSTLPLPGAIDAAYLLLVGQLCLSLSKLAFGVSFSIENRLDLTLDIPGITILVLSLLVVIMLFVNILSCWKSTRSTFDEIGHYPNSLLHSDILIIVSFFFLNSVAATPVSFLDDVSLDSKGIQKYLDLLGKFWEPIIPLLFVASSLLVASYRRWNTAYLSELELRSSFKDSIAKKRIELGKYNFLYGLFSILFAIFAVLQVLFDQFWMSVAFLTVWIVFWGYVNFGWMVSPPIDSKRSKNAD